MRWLLLVVCVGCGGPGWQSVPERHAAYFRELRAQEAEERAAAERAEQAELEWRRANPEEARHQDLLRALELARQPRHVRCTSTVSFGTRYTNCY